MTRTSRADVAVVGAGPAGAWAAYRLARTGARVTVIDGTHPREKPCGGGVTARALALVADAVRGREMAAVAIDAAIFETADGAAARVLLSSDTDLVVASRRDFDRALLAAAEDAGATLLAARATGVVTTRDGVVVQTSGSDVRADWLLGADGANSLVRRQLSAPFSRAQLSIATGYFALGVTSRDILVRFVSDPPGYLWSFPRLDHLAIGICAQADQSRTAPLRAQTARWIERSGVAAGATLVPYAWPIPSLKARDLDRERPSGARWMLLGDAAGLVDPITREGIFFALASADHAAAALAGAEQAPDAAYASRLRDDVYAELTRASVLKSAFFRGPVTRLLVEALDESRAIRAVMADLVAGRQPYRGLKRRLLATLELGLAWRLLWLARGR